MSQCHCVTLRLGLGHNRPGTYCVPVSLREPGLCNCKPKPGTGTQCRLGIGHIGNGTEWEWGGDTMEIGQSVAGDGT